MTRYCAAAAIVLAALMQPASGKLLDPESPPHAILDVLVDEVDSRGIDVSRRWSGGSAAAGERPVLAPLQGFASRAEAQAAQALWMRDFQGDVHSVLLGVKQDRSSPSPEPTNTSPVLTTFKDTWERAPRSQRVFISFTRADAVRALDVKHALDRQGFTTFIYLTGAHEAPALTPQEAGHFFATAGHHFVIDTKEARRSSGVWFEKALLGRYGVTSGPSGGTRPGAIRPTPPPPSPGSSGDTCICNTYRNGVLVSSRPIPRGARCGGQVCGE